MSTLIEDLKDWYGEESYPPDGPEVNASQVSHEYLDSQRWGTTFEVVYKRDDEYAAVRDVEPATEEQEWGAYGEPEIYEVEPYEVVTTRYREVLK